MPLFYVVSDEVYLTTPWFNNIGVTLPDDTGAVYNAGLAPIFSTRSGEGMIDALYLTITVRGQENILQSRNDRGNFLLLITSNTVQPSHTLNGMRAYPLRCLVSTNNG